MGPTRVENVQVKDGVLVAEPGKKGIPRRDYASPYVFVGGKLEVEGAGAEVLFLLGWKFVGRRWART